MRLPTPRRHSSRLDQLEQNCAETLAASVQPDGRYRQHPAGQALLGSEPVRDYVRLLQARPGTDPTARRGYSREALSARNKLTPSPEQSPAAPKASITK